MEFESEQMKSDDESEQMKSDVRYATYMVRCNDGSLYTGYSTDVERRVKTHNSGKGAKYGFHTLLCTEKIARFQEIFSAQKNAHPLKSGPIRGA